MPKILIADDSIAVRKVAERLLTEAGMGVTLAANGSEALALLSKDRPDLIAPMNDLIDRFDDIIDDHMHGGHTAGGDHEARHLATEGSLARLAGLALDQAASPEQLNALAQVGEARVASIAGLADAASKWTAARAAVRKAPAPLWPAILHLAVTVPPEKPLSPFSRRWRMLRAALTHRL